MIKKVAEIDFNTNASETKTKIDSLSNSTDKLTNSTKNNTSSLVDSNNSMKLADSLTGGMASKIKSAADSTGLMAVAQKALAIATDTGTTAMKVFQVAVASTGIGLIVIAVALLIDYFKDFDPLIDKIEQGMAAFGAAIRVVEQALGSLFSSSEDSSKSFKNLGDNMAKAANDAAKLKEAQQDLEDAMNAQDVANAKASQRYNELILQSKNRTLSEKERINLIKQADKIETDNFIQRKILADKDVNNAREAARIKGSLSDEEMKNLKERGVAYAIYLQNLGKITDKEVEALKKAQLGRIQIDVENTSRHEKAQNRADALADSQKAKEDKRNEEIKAARQKAAEEQAGYDKAYFDLKKKLSRELQDLEDKSNSDKLQTQKERDLEEINNLKGKTDAQLQVLRNFIEQKYKLKDDKEYDDLKKKLDKELADLTLSAQSKLDLQEREELDAIAKLTGKSEAERDILEKQVVDKYAILQKSLDDKTALEDKNRQDSINQLVLKNDVEKSYSDAKNFAEVEEIKTQHKAKLDLEEQFAIDKAIKLGASEAQIDSIHKSYLAKHKKDELDADAQNKNLKKAEVDANMKHYKTLGNAMQSFSALAGEQTAAGKALGIASATINTFIGISEVWAAKSMGNPVLDMAVKIASTAAVAAAGFANVKSILAVKVPGSAGGGGASVPSAPAQPSVSFQNTPQTQITDTINQATAERNSQPIKTYVVSKDVTSAQELDRNIITGAKF